MEEKKFIKGYIQFHGTSYEMTDELLEEVMEELTSMGIRKEDVLEVNLEEALGRVLTKKHNARINSQKPR